jgi:GR25 family glycosyltransferase involved in LPS biosynthesis
MKIGITLALKDNQESIWTNGIKQNVLILTRMLKMSPKNHEVCILNTVNLDWSIKPKYLDDIDIFNFSEKFMDMDLIIVMGSQIQEHDIKRFKESGNKKVISYKCGNNYILHVEDTLFKEDLKNLFQIETQYDEVWYIPQQYENNNGFYHTIYRTNTVVVPFIWDYKFLKTSLDEIDYLFEQNSYKKDSKYNPNNEQKVIGVMEPNLNVIKYCLIPTLITEESYRTDIGNKKIKSLMLTNSTNLSKNKHFLSIISSLDLFKDKKISSESRYQTAYIVSQYMDIVISHQLMNNLNYLYLDLAYMGYPVLHNANYVKDLGYYYEGSDTVDGASQLNWILENHDNNIENYNKKNKIVLDRFYVGNPELIETYDKLIHNLFNGGNKDLSFDIMKNNYVSITYQTQEKNDDTVFYVICCNEERLNFMKNQISDLKITYDVEFFKAHTPEDSEEWIVKNDTNSSDKLQCCFRSHISVMNDFLTKYPNKKYVCIVEDDVCFLNDGFEEKFSKVITQLSENKNIDYVSIGYLPTVMENKTIGYFDDEKINSLKKDGCIYYGLEDKNFTVWGTQAQIFPINIVKNIVNTLYKKNGNSVYESINEYVKLNGYKQKKFPYLTPDSLIPIMFRQGLVHPPLAIEGQIYSAIHNNDSSEGRMFNWKNYEKLGYIKISDFYEKITDH